MASALPPKEVPDSGEDEADLESPKANRPASGLHPLDRIPFFRSTLFQILVVGTCAFCAPGIWSAMNGLGVGGSQSPDLVNAANAILYAFMTVTCFAGPWLTNLIGFRWTLAIGALG